MGGGTKFDSIEHINNRTNIVSSLLKEFKIDDKRKFSNEDKIKVFQEQNNKCKICGTSLSYNNMHGDHIKSYSKGGSTTSDNLQILCPGCNLRKSNK